jgi:Tfp pilus assembly protein PilO
MFLMMFVLAAFSILAISWAYSLERKVDQIQGAIREMRNELREERRERDLKSANAKVREVESRTVR